MSEKCKKCGYCEHCGRSDNEPVKLVPTWVPPYYPWWQVFPNYLNYPIYSTPSTSDPVYQWSNSGGTHYQFTLTGN